MSLSQILLSQLADPFRIVLLIGLVLTMLRTRANTGTLLPLLLGLVFVAVLIPSTMTSHAEAPFWQQVALGAVANGVLLALIMGLYTAYQRLRARS